LKRQYYLTNQWRQINNQLGYIAYMLKHNEISMVHNCLLDFRDSSSLGVHSYIPILLNRLLKSEGVGLEMSGVYLSNDNDIENIPDYLLGVNGMAFEFMDEHVTVSFSLGAILIADWCNKNIVENRDSIISKCNDLIKNYQPI
jgi:hypothetical protein